MSDKMKKLKELMLKLANNASTVFIVGHNNPDYDSIGSALGIKELLNSIDIESYIIVNDVVEGLDPGVKKIIDATKEKYHIISLEDFKSKVDSSSLLITVDVNKTNRISVNKYLSLFSKILIIDHHLQDEYTIPTQYKYIDIKSSSTCEIVAQLLNSKQLKNSKNISNYLLAGIILDTKRFQKNTFPKTFDIVEKLYSNGADYDAVNKLFISNFLEDKLLYNLIFEEEKTIKKDEVKEIIIANTHIQAYPQMFGEPTVSYTLNRANPQTIYKRVDLAKTADKMLKYVPTSFVLGYTTPYKVGISARSIGEINVGQILERLQHEDFPLPSNIDSELIERSGGGNKESGGGDITTSDIFAVEKKVMELVQLLANPKQEIEKPIELVKKIKEVKVE